MVEISVIMPVYNAEKYLSEAIESVLNQSFGDFELILINDGSTDHSLELCKYYQKADSRIILISQQNAGISKTRNRGLRLAKGIYVAFIDDDDIYEPDLLKDNYKLIREYEADVVKFGSIQKCIDKDGNTKKINKRGLDEFAVITKEDLLGNFIRLRSSSVLEQLWNGLYEKEFLNINNILFDESIYSGSDDQLFNLRICKHLKKLIINPKNYYIWFQRDNYSTSKKFNEKALEELAYLCKKEQEMIAFLNKENRLNNFSKERICNFFIHNFEMLANGNVDFEKRKNAYCNIRKYSIYRDNLKISLGIRLLKQGEKRGLVVILYCLKIDRIFFKNILYCIVKKRNGSYE